MAADGFARLLTPITEDDPLIREPVRLEYDDDFGGVFGKLPTARSSSSPMVGNGLGFAHGALVVPPLDATSGSDTYFIAGRYLAAELLPQWMEAAEEVQGGRLRYLALVAIREEAAA